MVATVGRQVAKWQRPQTLAGFARSKVVWVVLGICGLLGVAYSGTGPVGFPRAVVTTAAGDVTGGYVGRGSDGVDVATCTALADATSTDTRLRLVPTRTVESVLVGGGTAALDTGARPSLARLALHALGIDADPPTAVQRDVALPPADLRGHRSAGHAAGIAAPQLGPGVVAGPAPPHDQALDGETPVGPDRYLTGAMAALARRYQPTLLVTAADRNWPVSVNAVLAERGANDHPSACIPRSGRGARRSAIPRPRSSPPAAGLPPASRAARQPSRARRPVPALPGRTGPGPATPATVAVGSELP